MHNNINLNESTSLSQNKSIIDYLLKGNRITSLEAVRLFGCMRLASRITDIKRMGYDIQSRFIVTDYSHKHVKEYWLNN